MTNLSNTGGWRSAGAAVLLVLTGAVLGVVVDRLWLVPPEAHAAPLTSEAMAERLGLSSAEHAQIRALLDSLHADILHQSPDSLGAAVTRAQARIESALPADARTKFREWMREHHEQLRGGMHSSPRIHGPR